MIVKMRKIAVLVASSEFISALRDLRKLGVVHIKHSRSPSAEGITALEHRISAFVQAERVLSGISPHAVSQEDPEQRAVEVAHEIISKEEERQKVEARLQELLGQRAWFQEWGDVSGHCLHPLEEKSVFVKLYLAEKKDIASLPRDKMVYFLGKKGGRLKLAFITRDKDESLDLEEVPVPLRNRHSLENKISSNHAHLQRLEQELGSLARFISAVRKTRKEQEQKLEFYKVRFGAIEEEGFCCIEGFSPASEEEKIKNEAVRKKWGYFFRDPGPEEEVPTLIVNPPWISIINPIFKLMGTVPGYREFDISFWFLLFFTVFVAMLVGDAAYGILFLALTFFLDRKKTGLPRQTFFLFYFLSSATIVWGALTGTWFGFAPIAETGLLSRITVSAVATFSAVDNRDFIIHLCFLIGAVHLSLAHVLVAIRMLGSLRFAAQLGWAAIIWGLYYYCEMFVLNRSLPPLANIFVLAGAGLVIFFSNINKGILKGALASLGDLPLTLVASFSDVMSYLRLFAVSFATVAMAVSVNGMAQAASETAGNIFLRSLMVAFILFIGHGINIVLATMGVLVHGVRLNLLEFSSHLGMEWTGVKYRPFKGCKEAI